MISICYYTDIYIKEIKDKRKRKNKLVSQQNKKNKTKTTNYVFVIKLRFHHFTCIPPITFGKT